MKTEEIMANFLKTWKSGVVTLCRWTLAPDGQKYLYFYCTNWTIITDKFFPIPGFRSSERWQMIALDQHGQVLAVFPGCQVKAFLICSKKPNSNDCGELA